MKKLTTNDPETRSADVLASNIEQLKALFPEAFTEGGLDFDVLKQLLGGAVNEREEKYGLNWHGKRRARQIALAPSTGTLRPCPEDSVAWDTTQNIMIEGDNLEVLKLLQKSYSGKVKLIYIDPPYNTGKDFVYPDKYDDNLATYLRYTGQVNDEGFKTSSNTEASGRFHTNWLNMMYPRLKLARNLLSQEGIVVVSIDDSELHHLRMVMDDVFGAEHFVATVVWQKKDSPSNDAKGFSTTHDYLVMYQRSDSFRRNLLPRSAEQVGNYQNPDGDVRGLWTRTTLYRKEVREDRLFRILNPAGREIPPPPGASWRVDPDRFKEYQDDNRIWWGASGDGDLPFKKSFLSEVADGVVPTTWWEYEFAGSNRNATMEIRGLFDHEVPFDTPKPRLLIQRLLQVCSSATSGHLILDFFAGSGTAGHAVIAQNCEDGGNRRYIVVQLPEPLDASKKEQVPGTAFCDRLNRPRNIAELTKERLRRAAKKVRDENPMFAGDLGFRVFRLDASNIREWDPDRQNLAKTLLESVDHLKTDRTETDILYELLLKLGLDLCVPIEKKKISGKDVHSIGGGVLLACLADKITRDQVEPLAEGIVKWHKALAPAGDTTCVFRDSAFADDVAKTNLAAILNQHGLANVRSL